MSIRKHLPEVCDGTLTVKELAEYFDSNLSYIQQMLWDLEKEGKVVLDRTKRPMKPYRPNLRPDYYFKAVDKNLTYVMPRIQLGGIETVRENILAGVQLSYNIANIVAFLKAGSKTEAGNIIASILEDLNDEQKVVMQIITCANVFGDTFQGIL